MDLNQDNYAVNLKELLEHLLHADFVSFDFEFSGIKTKPSRTVIEQMSTGAVLPDNKPTVQERYEEIREVADRYTIFQFGITIAEQDRKKGGYILRPYNIHVNPLIVHKMDIDRDVTISSSAAVFLQKNKFDLQKPFVEGVPYLSREEHRRAIQLESERLDGLNVVDINLDNFDGPTEAFVQHVRKKLKDWKPQSKQQWLMIYPPKGEGTHFEMLHRRIVHQIVRKEFKNFIATTNPFAMKILQFDAENELKHKRQKLDSFFVRLSRQIGLRWIIEALSGGDLGDIYVPDLYHDPTKVTWTDNNRSKADFAVLQEGLKRVRPVFVGHNPLTDLIYLYRTFVGPLPESVKEFSQAVNRMFPLVIDTKYMATHHGVMDASSLQDLDHEYRKQSSPKTFIPEKYGNYEGRDAAHEAGYDSLLTAQLVIKSAAKLAKESGWREQVPLVDLARLSLGNVPGPSAEVEKMAQAQTLLIDISDDEQKVVVPSEKHRTLREIAYQHHAIFTPLDIMRSRDAQNESVENTRLLLPKPVEPKEANPKSWKLTDGWPKWMPAWTDDFWLVFGNKLRVNGTKENVLDLTDFE